MRSHILRIRLTFTALSLALCILSALIALSDSRFQSTRQLVSALLIFDENSDSGADAEQIFASAWDGMQSMFDPYTDFIPAVSYQYVDEEGRGSFEGIGVEITVRDGLVTVISPIAGSHAEEIGLRPGDQVLEVDSVDVTDMDADGVTSRIRGPAGTTVLLKIRRPGLDEPFEVRVERRNVELRSVLYSGLVDSIGYIHLTRFSLTTPEEVITSLEEIMRNDPKGIILDMRGNPGGFMSSAVYVAGLFLPADRLVVATKSRRGWENYAIRTHEDGPLTEIPLAVLVSRGSASASEIVSGALQDYDRAVILGDTTFGKGLVQTNLMLPGDNALRVTTSKYYLPSGRLVQRFADKDWARNLDVSRDEMNTAYRTEGGRSVFGGGGVAPDIYVEADSSSLLDIALSYTNFYFRFAVDYRASHGDSIPATISDEILASFRQYVDTMEFEYPNFIQNRIDSLRVKIEGISDDRAYAILDRMSRVARSFEEEDWITSRDIIESRLCARFENLRSGRNGVYERCMLRHDRQVEAAVRVLSDTELYNGILTAQKAAAD